MHALQPTPSTQPGFEPEQVAVAQAPLVHCRWVVEFEQVTPLALHAQRFPLASQTGVSELQVCVVLRPKQPVASFLHFCSAEPEQLIAPSCAQVFVHSKHAVLEAQVLVLQVLGFPQSGQPLTVTHSFSCPEPVQFFMPRVQVLAHTKQAVADEHLPVVAHALAVPQSRQP